MIPLAKSIPITGLAPDDEPTKPGILTDCVNVVPTTNGVKVANGWSKTTPALAASITGMMRSQKTDGSPVFILASTAKLQVYLDYLTPTAHTDTVVAPAALPWSMTMFGNAALVSGYFNRIQQASSASGWTFSEVADAPKAKVIVSASNFVLAFGTNESAYGEQGDRWWCSAINDHSSWTPSLSTQATTGRIVQDGGGFTAALPLGQNVIAYKDRAMFVGSYVGSPVVWQWDRVPGYAGAAGPGCVCDIGGAHFIVGPDGFWLFDGTRPQPIGVDVIAQSFFGGMSYLGSVKDCLCYYNKRTTSVHVWFSRSSGAGRDSCLVYNVTTGTWGHRRHARQITAVGEYGPIVSGGVTTMCVAANDGSSVGYQWIDDDGTAPTPLPTMTTGVLGDDSTSARVLDLRLICASSAATGATVQGYTGRTSSSVTTAAGTGTEMDGKLPIRQHDRWHKFVISLPYVYGSATPEIMAVTINGVTGGKR